MEIEIEKSGYDATRCIDLMEARKHVQGRCGAVAIEVLRRWCNRGCRPRGASGPTLRFPALKINGEYRTMPHWVALFERKRLELAGERPALLPIRPARSREAAHRRAEEFLDAAGVK